MISVFIGWLPAMKITAPNSPRQRAKASEQPARNAGKIAGKITLRRICKSLAPSVRPASSTSAAEILDHRLHGAHHERQAGEGHRDARCRAACRRPECRARVERRAEPAVLGEQRGQRQAGDRGRQRERHIDQRIEQALAGKLIARQHPGQQQAVDRVEDGREEAPS